MESSTPVCRQWHLWITVDFRCFRSIWPTAFPRQLLLPLQRVSRRLMLPLQSVQPWINAWWTSMDQRLYSLCCCFLFRPTSYWFHRAGVARGEIKSLLCDNIYQRAVAERSGVAGWMVLSVNCTVTQAIDFSMTEHILVSSCGRWYWRTSGQTNMTPLCGSCTVRWASETRSYDHHSVVRKRVVKSLKVQGRDVYILNDTGLSQNKFHHCGHTHSKLVLKRNMPSDHFLAQRQHDLEG